MESDNFKIGFRLNQITTDQFAIIDAHYIAGETVELSSNMNFGIDDVANVLMISIRFTFSIAEKPFLIIEASCYFLIEKPSWEAFVVENKIVIPKEFVRHAAMHTVGTVRGILHSKTEDYRL